MIRSINDGVCLECFEEGKVVCSSCGMKIVPDKCDALSPMQLKRHVNTHYLLASSKTVSSSVTQQLSVRESECDFVGLQQSVDS